MDHDLKLTEKEMDALREIGNIGIGNAATALSKLVGKNVQISVHETRFIPIENFSEATGNEEDVSASAYLQVAGDLNGEVLFIFPRNCAMELIDLMMKREPGTTRIMESIEQSAFEEMANIFTGAYLNAMSKMFDLKIIQSVPHVAIDMTQAITDFVLIKLAQTADNILTVKTTIEIEGHDVCGNFIILLDKQSLSMIIDILQKKFGM